MIIDTTLFNNEFDMLDIHLEISKEYVDKWIILEADKRLNGNDKQFNLSNNIAKYKDIYGDKVEVVALNIPVNDSHRSYYETSMRKGFKNILDKYDNNDIIIHGDLDEILNPDKFEKILDSLDKNNKPVSCGFEMFMYKFDQRAFRGWKGSVVAKKYMFETPHDLYKGSKEIVKRKSRNHCVRLDEAVGWHWTWFGSDEIIKEKVISCIETDYRNPDEVLTAFKNNDTKTAINFKCDSEIVDIVYPEKIQNIIKKYPAYWHKVP